MTPSDTPENTREEATPGRWVHYRGSLDDHWGRYRIASITRNGGDIRYDLGNRHGTVILVGVRASSIHLIPTGPMHRVTALDLRLAAVRRAAHDLYGEELPSRLDAALRNVPETVAATRPVEAEHYLLSLEATVGCITGDEFQQRVALLVVTENDLSWTETPSEPTDDSRPAAVVACDHRIAEKS